MYRMLRNIVISLVATLMLFHSLSFDGLKIIADENSSENTTEYVNEEQNVAAETVTEDPVDDQPVIENILAEEATEIEPAT